VTVSTGEASLIADLAPRTGLELPDLPPPTAARLLAALPTLGYIGNPLDPWGASDPPTAYAAAFDAFAESGAYDVLALVHDFPYRSLPSELETARQVLAPLVAATTDRPELLPVFVSLTSGEPTPEILEATRAAGGIPVLRGAVEAFTAIAAVAAWERRRGRRTTEGPVRAGWPALAADRTVLGHDPAVAGLLEVVGPDAAADESRDGAPDGRTTRALSEAASLRRLARAGMAVVEMREANDRDGAVRAAADVGWPVVLKVDATSLEHKSDAGAVRLDLADPDAVGTAADELLALTLPAAAVRRGLLVSRQLTGVEMIVGGRRDASFGPIVLVGLGGVLAEVLDDVAVALAPVSRAEAGAMLDRLRGAAVLAGARGRAAIDRVAVIDALVTLSELLVSDPAILEVDCNPLISGPDATAVVDALIVEVDA
jgi:acyl-CoA synthetase (NDP forming)